MNSQADDDIGFGIYTDIADLPMTGCPSYIEEGIGGVCESGTATIVVFDVPFQIVPNVVITLMPWQLVFIKEISEDFRITFFKISKDMFSETLSTLWRPASGFLLYMHKHIVSTPDGELIGRFLAYCNLLVYRMKHTPQNCRQESIMQLLRVYFWDVYTVYINDPQAEKSLKFTRKDEYVYQFVRLIIEDHSPDKDVAYFAQKLGISPKRLTNLIRSISGQSAREWIVYYTILEIKSLLRESSLDIKSIAARVNFPDQTTLSRYFRHYTGVTPSQYRKNIYF
ncbi:helix-turn-helix domain-containing protein [Bacteroides fragilis]|uniref:helix-turn-helix domain-containing protein n=1 Tax=Bacteroides fragilis TaxID=817 RepID=UPI000445B6A9|nr:AraC family transcriptional regulator [Bacteroides fragilis]EXZ05606.1 bacterial regulatory helix-turn-helix s, AraC family protein [Bacteroides fragilis str. DS-208]